METIEDAEWVAATMKDQAVQAVRSKVEPTDAEVLAARTTILSADQLVLDFKRQQALEEFKNKKQRRR